MLLFTSQYNSTFAQITKNYVGITSTAVKNNNTLNFEQQSHRCLQQPPPIANSGHDQVITSGSTVFLNGSKSRSPNRIILGYSWKQIESFS